MDVAIQVVSARRIGDDRAEAFPRSGGYLLALADGAGGTSGGAAAANAVLASMRTFSPNSPSDCVRFLHDLDQRLTTVGQTTAVVVVVTDSEVFGASVGDSCAWLVGTVNLTDLTQYQNAKPLLGSGNAVPIGFGPLLCVGRVLIGSDGLFKYVPHDRIRALASSLPFADAAAALVDAARLRSGALQDDVAVIVAGQQGVAADGLVARAARSLWRPQLNAGTLARPHWTPNEALQVPRQSIGHGRASSGLGARWLALCRHDCRKTSPNANGSRNWWN